MAKIPKNILDEIPAKKFPKIRSTKVPNPEKTGIRIINENRI